MWSLGFLIQKKFTNEIKRIPEARVIIPYIILIILAINLKEILPWYSLIHYNIYL